jgi:hypothetical protein
VIMLRTLTLPNPVFQISRDLNTNNGNALSSLLLMTSIDARYLNGSTPARAYRLETFRSMGAISVTSTKQIRCYFVTKCDFVNPNPSLEEMRDLRVCGDKSFLEKVTENTLAIYQSVVDAVLQRSGIQLHVNSIDVRPCDWNVRDWRNKGTTSSHRISTADIYFLLQLPLGSLPFLRINKFKEIRRAVFKRCHCYRNLFITRSQYGWISTNREFNLSSTNYQVFLLITDYQRSFIAILHS